MKMKSSQELLNILALRAWWRTILVNSQNTWKEIQMTKIIRTYLKLIGRWPKLFHFVATPWGIDFLWFNAYYHGYSTTTKSSQAKNLPNTEKMGDQWLSPIKLYYSKKMWNFVFNYNKNDLHHQKAYKKPHIRHSNSFLILQIVFELLLF
jgi:hypothetical protein